MQAEDLSYQLDLLHEKLKGVARKIQLLKNDNLELLQENTLLKKQLETNKNSNFDNEIRKQKDLRVDEQEVMGKEDLREEIDDIISSISNTIDWLESH